MSTTYSGISIAEKIARLNKRTNAIYQRPTLLSEVNKIMQDLKETYTENKDIIERNPVYAGACARIQGNLLFAKKDYTSAKTFYEFAMAKMENFRYGEEKTPEIEISRKAYEEASVFRQKCVDHLLAEPPSPTPDISS